MPSYTFFNYYYSLNDPDIKLPLNFFYGFNEFLGELLIKRISSNFLEDRNDFNFRRYYFDDENNVSWQDIIEEAKSSSFFLQSRKMIVAVIRDQKKVIPSKDDLEIIMEYLKAPNPDTIFILYISLNLIKDDFKQIKKGKISKFLNNIGSTGINIVDLDRISEREVKEYIKSYLKESGVSITASAMEKILEIKGDDFVSILHQLDKMVISGIEEKSIDSEDIEKVITGIESHSIWDLTEAIEKEDTEKYLKILNYLFTNSIKPTLIIGTLVTHYNKIFTAKFLLKRNFHVNDIGKVLNQPAFLLNRFMALVKNFSDERLRYILKIIYKLDYESKTSGENSAKVLLENFIFQIRN
ncbi:MAG: DNA polymerase III subunit delta [Acidobacteriota bacterium]